MNPRQPANLPASVHQRLLNLSQQRGQEFNRLLTLFAIERLLYRLTQSPFAGRFVLKGALLFMVWDLPNHRPTRDLDLLGFGENSAPALAHIFQELCDQPVIADGLRFDAQSIQVSAIREEQEYIGQRIELVAYLGRARLLLQIDVGFGDSLSPTPVHTTYPALLEFPPPTLRVYAKETVVAEKLHAMVEHDLGNSRMKDFYDLWTLSRLFAFDGAILTQAIAATFGQRHTPIPMDTPTALTAGFADHPFKLTHSLALATVGWVAISYLVQNMRKVRSRLTWAQNRHPWPLIRVIHWRRCRRGPAPFTTRCAAAAPCATFRIDPCHGA